MYYIRKVFKDMYHSLSGIGSLQPLYDLELHQTPYLFLYTCTYFRVNGLPLCVNLHPQFLQKNLYILITCYFFRVRFIAVFICFCCDKITVLICKYMTVVLTKSFPSSYYFIPTIFAYHINPFFQF